MTGPAPSTEQRTLLGSLVEAAPDALILADSTGRIVLVNAQAELLFGEPRGRLIGSPIEALIPDRLRARHAGERAGFMRAPHVRAMGVGLRVLGRRADGSEFPAEVSLSPVQTPDGQYVAAAVRAPIPFDELPGIRAVRGQPTRGFELLIRSADGRKIPVLANAAPILSADGSVQGGVIVLEDISAMKELERLRIEWNSIVAHDLRQPLNSILLGARLLLRRCAAGDEPTRAGLDGIVRSVSRLNRMVNDLLDLSRVEARRLELSRTPTDLVALVRASVDQFALDAEGRRLDLQVRGEVPPVSVDPDRVAQVLENLLTNAKKYGRPGTPITVVVEPSPGEVSVSVVNEGEGLDAEQAARLFRRFQRTGDATRAGVAGIGLGLYIARELVEAHGGRIGVESARGAATTFRFTIPVTPRAATPPSG